LKSLIKAQSSLFLSQFAIETLELKKKIKNKTLGLATLLPPLISLSRVYCDRWQLCSPANGTF